MLARLGGDEFAALVPVVRSRADVEEIALRLERCFDEPSPWKAMCCAARPAWASPSIPEDGIPKTAF